MTNSLPLAALLDSLERGEAHSPSCPDPDPRAILRGLKHLEISTSNVSFLASSSPLGQGGFGVVQLAELYVPNSEPRLVAVKTLRTQGPAGVCNAVIANLVREVRVWARLDHPHVLPLIGFHLEGSGSSTVAWLISPRCLLGNAAQFLKSTNPNLACRISLVRDTSLAVQYLHELRPFPVCHGDLKAANVLINIDMRAMLCDFGLSKVMDDPTFSASSVACRGSIRYFSPELAIGDSARTLQSDIWAWGCLAVEMISDMIPFADIKQPGRIYNSLHEGKLPANIQKLLLLDELEDLIQVCWARLPSARPTAGMCAQQMEYTLWLTREADRLGIKLEKRPWWARWISFRSDAKNLVLEARAAETRSTARTPDRRDYAIAVTPLPPIFPSRAV